MQLNYMKMHGAGNRIVVVDERDSGRAPPPADTLRRLGDDNGLGFDQLMWLGPAERDAALASYRVFNADGSEVEQCGNGVRCVAWLLGQADDAPRTIHLDSPAGPVEARLLDDGRVSVDMGPPEFEPDRVPFDAPGRAGAYSLEVDGEEFDVSVLSMGNPHCVLRVDDVAAADVAGIGAAIEHHPRFPQRTNVEFMEVSGRDAIELRVHERGVGETLACGTGACAAVVAGRELGLLDDEVSVRLPGGELVVSWRGLGEPVWLTGRAELISEGSIDL